jgi:D-alanyl-D-alanine carboxypeptidase/D-alanyl-D-alanine-endopeptidase (penicillin-binding protein 4)
MSKSWLSRDRGVGRRASRRSALWLLALLLAGPCLPTGAPPLAAPPAPQSQKRAKPPKERADIKKFRERVEKELAEPRAAKGHWGILVVDAETGETVYKHNADHYFTPASNTKLFTTALAMVKLGPAYQFRTTVETAGKMDAEGRLAGNVVLVGRGDPNLSPRKLPYDKDTETDGAPEKVLAALADQVAAIVKQIDGDVVADDSYFPYDRYPSGWAIDDMLWRYGAPVSALAVNDNVITVELRAGLRVGEPAWTGVEPWAEFYDIRSTVTTGPAGTARELRVQREPGSRVIEISGSFPIGREPEKLNIAVEEPAEHAAALLKKLLEARGVRIYGQARAQHRPLPMPGAAEAVSVPGGGVSAAPAAEPSADVTVLAQHFSLPLIDAVTLINKISQNLHTEMLLRTVAREITGDGSLDSALKLADEFYQYIGIAENDVRLLDGSGLSRRNLVTPRAAVTLLRWVAMQPWGEAYRLTLPIAGDDGTLEDRMKNTAAAGRIRAKTGTLDNVNSLSGYAETVHGQKLVFSIYGNLHNLRGRRATNIADAICVAMVEELGAKKKR